MVTDTLPAPDPGRALALSYAPAQARAGLMALLALDDRLAGIVRTTREPLVGQMRLTWWFEALERLDREPPPAEPVLRALATDVLPHGVSGASLAGMIDGWEAILSDDPLDDANLVEFAERRGAALFEAMAAVSEARDEQVWLAGEGWALADLSRNLSRPEETARARAMALERLRGATSARWSRAGRGIGALALLARSELEGRGASFRVGRLLLHRFTGR